jgi:hypothetical protein
MSVRWRSFKLPALILLSLLLLVVAILTLFCLTPQRFPVEASVLSVKDSPELPPNSPWLTPSSGWTGQREVAVDITCLTNAAVGSGYAQLTAVKVGGAWREPPIGCTASDTMMKGFAVNPKRQAIFVVPANVEAIRVGFNYTATPGLGRLISERTAERWLRLLVRPISSSLYTRLYNRAAKSISPQWQMTPVDLALPPYKPPGG